MQTLYDADSTRPDLFNAYPVQMAFTHDGRGLLATLHTVFRTSNGGQSWTNLDPFPPPNSSNYSSLRTPVYITGIAARPVMRTSIAFDSLLLSTENVSTNIGRVRLISVAGGLYVLHPDTLQFFRSPFWTTGIAVPDSQNAYAFAGFDHLVYHCDSLDTPAQTLWDSLFVPESDAWIGGPVASSGNLIVGVGNEQWVSRDRGATWATAPAADAQSDFGVSFADELHGLTGGGMLDPAPVGWVHRTTDGGLSWSGRVLQTTVPIRCVEMITPEIGFAAGGDYNIATGEIWKTTDGGQTWNLDALLDAEITTIESARASGAYVDVMAAGVFPDFSGGVWFNRLYLPNLSGPVIVAEPDTLDFGSVAPGDTALLTTTVQNLGGDTAIFSGATSTNSRFGTLTPLSEVTLPPQQSFVLHLIFVPSSQDGSGTYTATFALLSSDGRTELSLTGHVPVAADDPRDLPLPQAATLSVWPNPGNAVFQIRYELTRASDATISIYDLSGRTVATLARGVQEAGQHVVVWDAESFASGIYFVRLTAVNQRVMQKVLLLK